MEIDEIKEQIKEQIKEMEKRVAALESQQYKKEKDIEKNRMSDTLRKSGIMRKL